MQRNLLAVTNNITWHAPTVTRGQREELNGHKSFILWLTGLSGAGKSTLAHRIEEILFKRGCRTYVLDGDNVRQGLCRDLGFSPADRQENIRRVGAMGKLMADAGLIVITAFISPFRVDRDSIRALIEEGDFIEVYCDAPLQVCEERDVKGLYQKARKGVIPEFTGISSPYEVPLHPEIIVQTGRDTIDSCALQIIEYLDSQEKLTTTHKKANHT
jgi:adenylylsulfate kinase